MFDRIRSAVGRAVCYVTHRLAERSTIVAISTAVATSAALPRFAFLFIALGILGALVPDGSVGK